MFYGPHNVKATREGRIGSTTASGYVVDVHVPFVALPDREALFRVVWVFNPKNYKSCLAMVLDVGPWNEHDSRYVFGSASPLAETSLDERGRETNGAGIDLSEAVWNRIGMTDNGRVLWMFVG